LPIAAIDWLPWLAGERAEAGESDDEDDCDFHGVPPVVVGEIYPDPAIRPRSRTETLRRKGRRPASDLRE
jgi:hypothetical protein